MRFWKDRQGWAESEPWRDRYPICRYHQKCHYPKLRTDARTYIQKLGDAETLARYSFFRVGLLFASKVVAVSSLRGIFGLDPASAPPRGTVWEQRVAIPSRKTASARRRPSASALCIPVNGSRSFIECLLRSTQMPLRLFTACQEVMGPRASTTPGTYVGARRGWVPGYITPVSRERLAPDIARQREGKTIAR